jgi:hypothetical protein
MLGPTHSVRSIACVFTAATTIAIRAICASRSRRQSSRASASVAPSSLRVFEPSRVARAPNRRSLAPRARRASRTTPSRAVAPRVAACRARARRGGARRTHRMGKQ